MYHVDGVSTTLPFGTFVMEHDAFRSGNFDTNFVKKYYDSEVLKAQAEKEAEVAALVALKQYLEDQKIVRLPN
jgi:propionyl-CoA carboxylase alpha chain